MLTILAQSHHDEGTILHLESHGLNTRQRVETRVRSVAAPIFLYVNGIFVFEDAIGFHFLCG